MIIGNRLGARNSFNLLINSNIIHRSNTVKYLGVILDNKLTWQPHIDNISKKTLENVVAWFLNYAIMYHFRL